MIEGICPKLFPFPCFLAQLEAFLKYEYCHTLMRLCASEEICIPPSRWSYVFTFNEWNKKKAATGSFLNKFQVEKISVFEVKTENSKFLSSENFAFFFTTLKINFSLHTWNAYFAKWKILHLNLIKMQNLKSQKIGHLKVIQHAGFSKWKNSASNMQKFQSGKFVNLCLIQHAKFQGKKINYY